MEDTTRKAGDIIEEAYQLGIHTGMVKMSIALNKYANSIHDQEIPTTAKHLTDADKQVMLMTLKYLHIMMEAEMAIQQAKIKKEGGVK